MGLIKMITSSVGSALSDQVIEYFRCDGMDEEILVKPATLVRRGNVVNNASDCVISNGSVFDVAVNQCALLVENGKVHDLVIGTSETAGQYKYDSTVEPSILGGGLKDIGAVLKELLERFKAGGQSTNTMRLMYVNMLEIHGNKIGIGRVPFMDNRWNVLVQLQGYGTYSFRITQPVTFYERVCGAYNDVYPRTKLAEQMKNELLSAMQPALAAVNPECKNGYQDIAAMPRKVGAAVNEVLMEEWENGRGISIENVALASLTVDEKSQERIEHMDDARVFGNGNVGMGRIVDAQAEAMTSAAKNEAGAFTGFMGLGMVNNAGGYNASAMLAQQQANGGVQTVQPAQNAAANGWTCACGAAGNTGKFCSECGAGRPDAWDCACGKKGNTGKFCPECGASRPVAAAEKFCSECGAKNAPGARFCGECGKKFD